MGSLFTINTKRGRKMKDWKEYNCSIEGCKKNRYNRKLKICINHYMRNKRAEKRKRIFKQSRKHYKDVIKFRAKYKYIREAILLVTWYEEYKAADVKKSKIKQIRERYILRSKYNRFSPDMLKCFSHGSGTKDSDINHEVVHNYKNHIKWLEANDFRCRTVLKKKSKVRFNHSNKKYINLKKKEEEDEKRIKL